PPRTVLLAAGAAVVALGAGALVPVVRSALAAPDFTAALPDLAPLPLRAGPDGVLRGDLVAAPAGAGLRYNGGTPLLKLKEGDRVRLAFRNDLDAPSSLHLHGLPLPPAVDAPLDHLEPGGTSVQEFTVPEGTAGTYWYHPHAHGDVERQLLAGLAGPIVVAGPADHADWDDRLLMFTRVGRDIAVNGAVRPVFTPNRGLTRLRLLNATAGDHLLLGAVRAGARLPLHLIATDGGLVDRPVELTEVLLAPGERGEVLVDTSAAGRFTLTALPYSVYGAGGATSAEVGLVAADVPAGLAAV
ncbi:multicopper oxidase family protein, partial [Saccharothrix hoggarensis]